MIPWDAIVVSQEIKPAEPRQTVAAPAPSLSLHSGYMEFTEPQQWQQPLCLQSGYMRVYVGDTPVFNYRGS
ncbi:hypothetical protein N0V85_005874 [Neurospora sp. IMI 360204]|nr:hypothetical protein N0V85_005874 [Neurospora sp. IMI 360204]